MRDLTSAARLRYVARSVLLSPLSLVLWAVGGAACYLLHSALPLGAAVLAQLALLYLRLHDEAYLRRLFQGREEREELLTDQQVEDLLGQMDFETRQRLRYILQLQKELVREARASDTPEYARADLDRIAGQVGPLVQRATRIATRKQQLVRYLRNVDERALSSYCNNLRQRIAATADPVTKAQFEQALQAREAELETYRAITQAAERIDGQLESVEATFASWKAKVIRIKTADVASAASVSEGLYQELSALNSDIDVLDSSVTEALKAEAEIAVQQQG